MWTIVGFLIIGYFIGGISMLVACGIINRDTNINERYGVTIVDNKTYEYIAFRCNTAELVVDGTRQAIKKLQKD